MLLEHDVETGELLVLVVGGGLLGQSVQLSVAQFRAGRPTASRPATSTAPASSPSMPPPTTPPCGSSPLRCAPRHPARLLTGTNAFLGKPTDTNTSLELLGARQYDPLDGPLTWAFYCSR